MTTELREQVTRALATLRAVEALHAPGHHGMCSGCGWTYPCPTRRILDAS